INASTPLSNQEGEIIGNKSEPNKGSFDYWVMKLSSSGEIEWEKTYGGMFSDELKSIVITKDGYLIGGNSNSPDSGNKNANNLGMNDYWVIQLNEQGEEQWQKTYGGEGDESLAQIIETENGYLLAGSSNSKTSETKKAGSSNRTDFWVMEINKEGEPIWDTTYDFGKWDVLVSVLPLTPSKGGGTPSSGGGTSSSGEYLLGGYASTETLGKRTDNKGVNDYIALKINDRGEMLWSKAIGG